MTRTSIPNDEQLARMTRSEQNALANEIAAAGDTQLLECLSDALLRIHQAWRDGAHSELSDTARRRRIVGNETPLDGKLDCIVTSVSDESIRRAIRQAARAGCTRRQQEVWTLHEIVGCSQVEIAGVYGTSQQAVSSCLARAREAIWDHLDKHSPTYVVFIAESHRSAYFPPAHRPELPTELEPARQALERKPKVTTHIQIEHPRRVEIWHDGEPPPPQERSRDKHAKSYTFRQIAKMAKQIY